MSAIREDICTRLRRGVPHPNAYDQPMPPYDIGAADDLMTGAADMIDELLVTIRNAVHYSANKFRTLGNERHRETIRAEGLEDTLSLLVRSVETVCAYSPDDDSDDDFKAAFEQLRATLKRMPV